MDCHGLRGLAKTGGEESVKSIKHAPWPSRRDFTGVRKVERRKDKHDNIFKEKIYG